MKKPNKLFLNKENIHKVDRMENKNLLNNTTANNHNRKEPLIILGLFILLFIVILIPLGLGRYGMNFSDIISAFMSLGNPEAMANQNSAVLFVIRLPRIFLAILVGAALTAAGAAYQGLFKNPMVSPDILGVSSGASVGACLGILLSFSDLSIQVLAFVFGLGAVFLVLAISRAVGRGTNNLLIMILAGTVISALFSALTSLIKYLADTDTKLPEVTFWLMGSFAKTDSWKNVLIMLMAFLVGVVPIMLLRWKINVMSFGEEEAQSMGVNTKRVRLTLTIILAATLLTASSVALCGIVGWVGLIMPHIISRFIVGPNYKYLLPTALLICAIFMLIVDNVARFIGPEEIPLGILTAIIGNPLFIYLLWKGRKGGL